MPAARVTAVRSIELGVPDLARTSDFYCRLWGLAVASREHDGVHLRGTGAEHHILSLRERPRASLNAIGFAAPDRAAVDALHGQAVGFGAAIVSAPAPLPPSAGGGYGFSVRTPEGLLLCISAEVACHDTLIADNARPVNLTHVVINSADVARQLAFFRDVLGFRLSDTTDMMEFIRCGSDHHSIAIARSSGPSLNHMAFAMSDLDGLMLGSGRMRRNGFEIEWGVGRHGPGNNIFSYFIEPNGFVAEYTTGMQQIDEATYAPQTAEYWRTYPLRPCRWGMAMHPSERIKRAFQGILESDTEAQARCEDIIARKRAG